MAYSQSSTQSPAIFKKSTGAKLIGRGLSDVDTDIGLVEKQITDDILPNITVSSIAKRNTDIGNFSVASKALVNQINSTWFVIEGNYVYSISKGSYDGNNNTLSSFDVFDIKNPDNIKRVASYGVGLRGINVRGIDKIGEYIYFGTWDGKVLIWNVADIYNAYPVSSLTVNGGGIQNLHVVSNLLVVPTWGGLVNIYNINGRTTPQLLISIDESASSSTWTEVIRNGNLLWVIGYLNDTTGYSLMCIDISDNKNPVKKSVTAFPDLIYARYGVIDENKLYVGGFARTSKVCIVDVSTETPILEHVFNFNLSSMVKRGDYLIGHDGTDPDGNPTNTDTVAWNISDINNPIKTVISGRSMSYPKNYGAHIIGFLDGEGPPIPNAAPNDSNTGGELAVFNFNPLKLDGLDVKSLKVEESFTNKSSSQETDTKTSRTEYLYVSKKVTANEVSVIDSDSQKGLNSILGVGSNTIALSGAEISNAYMVGKNIFSIGAVTGGLLLNVSIDLYGITNQSQGNNAGIAYEKVVISGLLTDSAWLPHLAARKTGRVTNGNAAAPVFDVSVSFSSGRMYINVKSVQLNSSGSMLTYTAYITNHVDNGDIDVKYT